MHVFEFAVPGTFVDAVDRQFAWDVHLILTNLMRRQKHVVRKFIRKSQGAT